jgi:hypothetical protein
MSEERATARQAAIGAICLGHVKALEAAGLAVIWADDLEALLITAPPDPKAALKALEESIEEKR